MRPASPALEKALRRRIRREVESSEDLLRERKAHRRRSPTRSWSWLCRAVLPFAALGLAAIGPGAVELVCLALSLYATGTACLRAVALLHGLWGSDDLMVLGHLPAADADLFRLQWRKFIRSSLWILWAYAVFFGGLALHRELGVDRALLAAALGLAQWLMVAGLAATLAAWKPNGPWRAMGLALNAGALGCWLSGKTLLPFVKAVPGLYLLALPGGWVTFAFRYGILGSESLAFAALLPAAAAAALLAWAKGRMRRGYRLSEIAVRGPSAEMFVEHELDLEIVARSQDDPELVAAPWKAPEVREDLRRSIASYVDARVRERGFLGRREWRRAGCLDALFGRLLSERERAVAEFLIGGPSGLTRRWKFSAAVAALGIAALFVSPDVGLVLGGVLALTLVGGRWPAFQDRPCAGKFMPLLAAYPVGYAEVSRVLIKFNAVRILGWAPLAVAFAAVAGHATGLGLAEGAWVGLKAAFLALAFAFFAAVGYHSSGTNDTEHLTFRGCFGLILPAALLTSIGLGSAVLLFLPFPAGLAGGVGVAGAAVGFWGLYGLVYDRGRIDLVRSSASGTGVAG